MSQIYLFQKLKSIGIVKSQLHLVEFPIKIHMNHKTAAAFLREKIKLHEQNSPKVKIIGEAAQNLKKQQPYRGIMGNGRTSQRIKIAMWNVNGIRSVLNKNALHNFINQFAPDILCINETKINQQQFDKSPIQMKGYSGYWNFCKVSAGYSGVAIFSKFLPLSKFEDLQEPIHSQQGRVLTLQFQHFYLVAVYIPSAGDKKLERLHYKTQIYEKAFQKYCESLKTKGKGVIVCGDLNVCHEDIDIYITPQAHKNPGFTNEQRKSFNDFLKKGWIDTFRKLNPTTKLYTWWRIQHGNRERNIGKRLDYFLVNENFFKVVVKSEILSDVKGSDHCPVYLIIDLKKLKEQKKQQTTKVQTDNQTENDKEKVLQPQLEKKESSSDDKKTEKEGQCSQKQIEDALNSKDIKQKEEQKLQSSQNIAEPDYKQSA